MRYIPGNAQNIGSRQSQQDSFGFGEFEDREYVAHAGFLAIVCDGMGGMQHGDLASKAAVKAFLAAYRLKTADESIPDALDRSTRAANDAVCELSHSMGGSEGLGTTLVACALEETNLYWISVGDSNAYLCRQGNMMLLTQAHVFSNLLDKAVARGTISREDADRHPERDSLTSFVGIENLEEIDRNTQPFPLADGDTILIASDGLFKTLSDEEILAMMQGAAPGWPDLMVARTMAAQREHQDNVTVVTVTLTSAEPVFTPPPSGIRLPPATPIGTASGIGMVVPAGLPPMAGQIPPVPMAASVSSELISDAPMPAIPGAPAPFPASSPPFPSPPFPMPGSSPAIAGDLLAAAPKPGRVRLWPALVLVGILLIAAAVFFVRREAALSAKPAVEFKRQDSSAPLQIQTAPLPGVQPPALEPGRLIKPEPAGPDRVAVPKPDSDKPKPDEKKTNPEARK